jgi:hypothetical protein
MIGMAELAGVVPGDTCRLNSGHEILGGFRLVRVITTRSAFRAAIRRRRLNKTKTRLVRINVWEDGTISNISTFLDPRDAGVTCAAVTAMPAPEWVR